MHRNPKQFAVRLTALLAISILTLAAGCQQPLFKNESRTFGLFEKKVDFETLLANSQLTVPVEASATDRLAAISGDEIKIEASQSAPQSLAQTPIPTETISYSNLRQRPNSSFSRTIVRGQSPGGGDFFGDKQVEQAGGVRGVGSSSVQTGNADSGSVEKVAFQYPEFETPDRPFVPGNGLNSPNVGSPNELNPLVQPFERGGVASFPQNYADLDIYVTETQTGRINFGGAYNSDNGIVGQFTIDEKNFDIMRWPRNFREIIDGTAWRGGGQAFRLELVPGANLERYLISISEPYLFGTDYSFSASGYLFDRAYFDWDEQRLGGRFAVGRRLTPDLSISGGVRLESVTVDNARLTTSTELNNALGTSNLFLGNVGLVRDTRDSTVIATQGSFLSMTYSQAFGDYSFARGDVDYRRYKLLYERPDGSGRHTISVGTKLGFSGSSTPIFENYFAGGFSTMRGYDFRGASPVEGGVRVGGEFQWLNSVEYMFPITADDMIRGVLFCDFGTVEEKVEINTDNFRVAPGFGFRVNMPGGGMGGAPLAFDFAFPVASADGDEEKIFSFYLGVLR